MDDLVIFFLRQPTDHHDCNQSFHSSHSDRNATCIETILSRRHPKAEVLSKSTRISLPSLKHRPRTYTEAEYRPSLPRDHNVVGRQCARARRCVEQELLAVGVRDIDHRRLG